MKLLNKILRRNQPKQCRHYLIKIEDWHYKCVYCEFDLDMREARRCWLQNKND